MDWLNYHHLFYFWVVAREGTIAAACEKLRLAPPTISAQLRELEKALGERLFARVGRRLALTDSGRVAYRYAEEIFSLGREFVDAMKGGSSGPSLRLNVGAHDVLPKVVAYRLLEPVFHLADPVRVVCYEGTPTQLLPQLSIHELDLVLSDAPIGPDIKVRAFSHLLGECGIAFFASPALARELRNGFPQSLDGKPALLPTDNASMRGTLEKWFDSVGVRPSVVAEFEDIELMRVFGQQGLGFFAAHDVIINEVAGGYDVEPIGSIEGSSERFYAITVERRIKHPAVVAITEAARDQLFR